MSKEGDQEIRGRGSVSEIQSVVFCTQSLHRTAEKMGQRGERQEERDTQRSNHESPPMVRCLVTDTADSPLGVSRECFLSVLLAYL